MPRYYCIMRPPAPGAIPAGRTIRTIEVFDERKYIPEINRMAWGWVTYTEELAPNEVAEYELIMQPREVES